MSSGGFGAQTSAITTAASAFDAQATPIQEQANRLETLLGTGSSAGRDYAAQGDAYHQTLTGALQAIVQSYSQKCTVFGTNLTDTATSYDGTDQHNAAGLKSSGGGA